MTTQFLSQGGSPITPELAKELRQLVFGTSAVPMRNEWTHTPFAFGAPRKELSYGLRSPRNATRGLLSVVQGFIMKYLLFDAKAKKYQNSNDPLSISVDVQKSALLSALVEILRIVADNSKVMMVLPSPSDESFVQHSANYFHDSVTEKLYIFTLNPHDELEIFLKRYYKNFTDEGAPGALLLLYSAVLTRSISKVRSDLDTTKAIPLTMANNEEGSLMIVTLLLTGRATPFLHNGVVYMGDEKTYAIPQYGILKRCTIGLLVWENMGGQSDLAERMPGSRLKTPNFPIWITSCAGHYGVMFNFNPELLRNYHAESRFDLDYYCNSGNSVTLTVDNRSYNEQAIGTLTANLLNRDDSRDHNPQIGSSLTRQSSLAEHRSASSSSASNRSSTTHDTTTEILNTPLLKLIHTKWEEAHVLVHSQPAELSFLFSVLYEQSDDI